jgi:hypothetical protein
MGWVGAGERLSSLGVANMARARLLLVPAILAACFAASAWAQPAGPVCDYGFRPWGPRCIAVHVPRDADLDEAGHGWTCREGFRRVGEGCLPDRGRADLGAPPARMRESRSPSPQVSPRRSEPAAPPTRPLWTGAGEGANGSSSRPVADTATTKPAGVRHVQSQLAMLGYLDGPVDGRFDDRTERSIRRFQAATGAPADGRITMDLYERLHSEYNYCVVTRSLAADPVPVERGCAERAE